jgi:hypothetical protein
MRSSNCPSARLRIANAARLSLRQRHHLDDAGGAGIADELLDARRTDAAPLVGVGDLEGDLARADLPGRAKERVW